MDFKTMKDSELASVMVHYITRVEHLQHTIGSYLEGNGNITSEQIRKYYAEIKEELRADGQYLGLQRNRSGSSLYMGAFVPSIKEAAAFGFTVPINGAVDQKMYNAVAEASYKMTKYYTLEEWGRFM